VPFDVLYGVFEALFESRSPPWHTSKALSFVATEAVLVLESWIDAIGRARARGGAADRSIDAYDELPVVDIARQLDRFASSVSAGDAQARLGVLRRRLQDLS